MMLERGFHVEPQERSDKMPCDFRTITNVFDLPAGGDIDIDLEFPAPGVNAGRRAILMYRASVTGGGIGAIFGATLKATLNGEDIFEQVHFRGSNRSFHKVFEKGIVQPTDNKLTLIRTSGGGTIHLSDIVLVYGL